MQAKRRVLIDGTMARGGGGFTYLVNMVPALSRLAPDFDFRVLVSSEKLADALEPQPGIEIDFLGPFGLKERLRFNYLQAARLAADWKADLYFSAGESAPLDAPCPTIASFRNPNVFTLGEGQNLTFGQRARLRALNGLARLSARSADRVMFVSDDSASWIGDKIGLPRHRRAVVHHGMDPAPWRAERTSRSAPVPHDRPYILSVSSIYPYKNFVRLIEGYAELAARKDDAPDLVILGDDQDPTYSAKMRAAREATGGLAERIHIIGEVPYADVRRYYSEAALFVFPSHLETFGHPMLEAMASDVPLVAADIPVFREIAADAAFYGDPFDSASLATAMEEALFQPGASEQLVKRGRERLKLFTWDRSAERLVAMFESVLAEQQADVRERARIFSLPPARRRRATAAALTGLLRWY